MARSIRRMHALVRSLRADSRGATAIEYSIVAAGVAGAVVLAVYTLGGTVSTHFYDKLLGNWQ